jgi:mRNA-degrading endonuclease toxin of MazEF toxin-antitoxin module
VLVVSPNYRNERAGDVIVVPCSTVVRIAPTHVTLRKGEGGVPARSVLKCEQITTLPVGDVGTKALGGRLPAKRLAEAERAILRAIGLPIPELPWNAQRSA